MYSSVSPRCVYWLKSSNLKVKNLMDIKKKNLEWNFFLALQHFIKFIPDHTRAPPSY